MKTKKIITEGFVIGNGFPINSYHEEQFPIYSNLEVNKNGYKIRPLCAWCISNDDGSWTLEDYNGEKITKFTSKESLLKFINMYGYYSPTIDKLIINNSEMIANEDEFDEFDGEIEEMLLEKHSKFKNGKVKLVGNSLSRYDKLEEEYKHLNDKQKLVYISIIENECDDIEELKDIVHEIFFYDKGLYSQLRFFPKDASFEQLKANKLAILRDSLHIYNNKEVIADENDFGTYEGNIDESFGDFSADILNIDLTEEDREDYYNSLSQDAKDAFINLLSDFEQELVVAENNHPGWFWTVFDGDSKMIDKINDLRHLLSKGISVANESDFDVFDGDIDE